MWYLRKDCRNIRIPGSQNLIKYLQILFKPEEGELLLEFLEPATCKQVAERLNIDENTLSQKWPVLNAEDCCSIKMMNICFIGNARIFCAHCQSKKGRYPGGFWKAWDDFMPEIEERMIKRSIVVAQEVPVGGLMTRIIPARLALDSNPDIKPEDILPEEDIHALLRMKGSQEVIAVSDCDCRIRAHKCDRPTLNCFEFGKYAEFNLGSHPVSRWYP
jgi:hypothetical protein